jgi:hypothetical protein
LYVGSSRSRLGATLVFPSLLLAAALRAAPGFFACFGSFSFACASIIRFFRSILRNFSLGADWCLNIPTWVGAVCCKTFALAMISANEPFGGGFDDTGVVFWGAGAVLLVGGFMDLRGAMARALLAAGVLLLTRLTGAGLIGP